MAGNTNMGERSQQASEGAQVAERLHRECKSLSENSRKLMREYREKMASAERLPSDNDA